MKIFVNSKEIPFTRVSWSGDYAKVSRKLELGILHSPTDTSLPIINVAVGDMVQAYENDVLIFKGHVFFRDKAYNSGEINVTAYDNGVYLLKNEAAYNFKNMTAESITTKVCKDFGITVGQLVTTGIKQSYISTGESLYDIIMKVYSKAAESTGKKYLSIMMSDKFYVIERGNLTIDYMLENGINLTNSVYTESIENMINSVQVIDDNYGTISIIDNADWIKQFGKLQKVYKKESDINYNTAAKNMLTGIEQTGNIESLGNIYCITGYMIGVKDPYTGLVGLFNIDNDIHTWENDNYIMNLQLNMSEIMDEKSYKQKKQSNSSKSSINKTPLVFK